MKNQNWKLKYNDLKLKFMDAVDVSFRLGYEQGAQAAQFQQAQQAQMAAQQPQPGQENPGQEAPGSAEPQSDGSELDQHIGNLESLLAGAKPGSAEQSVLEKSLKEIKSFQSNLKSSYDLKKSEEAIKSIGKSMKPVFSLSKAATKNMSEPAKKALSMQEQIVDELMKSFAEEEKKASEAIARTLSIEQLLKG